MSARRTMVSPSPRDHHGPRSADAGGLNGAASAQFSDEPPRAYQPPAKRAKLDRNDAYSGPSNTPGLGTLDGSNASPANGAPVATDRGYGQSYGQASGQGYGQPQPYGATNDRPQSYGNPPQAYGTQAQSGRYAPSYGAPARPYGAETSAPQGVTGAPAQYSRDTYANAGAPTMHTARNRTSPPWSGRSRTRLSRRASLFSQ